MCAEKKDIFDKLMSLPVLRFFEPFYKKYKEMLLYLFFGGVSVFLNIGLFMLINATLPINELVNNIICWTVCVLMQFFTNRIWVFESKVESTQAFIKQMASFVGGRVFTLVLEEVILAVFITWLQMNATGVKLVAQIVVIVLNYLISKLLVFR